MFLDGKKHYRAKRYLEALRSFQQARSVSDRPSIVMMIANCYRQLQHPDRALAHYREYLAGWRRANHQKPSPYQQVVESHISHMKTIVELVRRGEALLQEGNPAAALPVFQAANQQNSWPRIRVGIALCHKQLGQRSRALTVIDATLAERRKVLSDWKQDHPNHLPTDHEQIERTIDRLEQLRRSVDSGAATPGQAEPSRQPALATPAAQDPPGEQPAGRSVLWLATGIATAALAVGFEVGAWVSYSQANQHFTHEPEYDTYRSLTIAGHVLAGVCAAAAGTSFVLYYMSGPDEAAASQARLWIQPTAGGATVSGALRF